MKAVPLPYQCEAVEQIDQFKGRALLAHEMGLGKTLIALWWWKKTPKAHPGLVVCPALAKYVWERECLHNLGVRPLVLEGRKSFPLDMSNAQIVIVNYDVLDHWLPELRRTRFRSIFLDEIHYAKNTRAKRTKAVHKLAKGIRYIVAISGTPLLNRPIELFPTLRMLKPGTFRSRYAFANAYCKPRWTPWGWKYDGATRLDDLHKLLTATCMIRRLKTDVLPELPGKIRRVLQVPLLNEGEYQAAQDDFLRWLSKKDPLKAQSAARAETLAKLGYLKRLAARGKLKAVVNWLNEWLVNYPNEKIVVFAIHKPMIRVLRKRIESKSVVVDGSVTGRQRKMMVQQFQQDKKTRVFIGNIRAAGIGITLTAANTLAFAELDWVPANHTQAEDRIHRLGQDKQVWIWYLVAANTIEEKLCEVLEKKQRVVQSTLDGGTIDDLDVYRQLMKKIRKGEAL